MCAQFGVFTTIQDLKSEYKIHVPENFSSDFDLIVRGFMKTDLAPIIVNENNQLTLKAAHFSLVPHWASEFPVKFSTYNARMERANPKTGEPEFIYQVPSFRDSFNHGHTCLVPMNYAVESTYFGKSAGNMVKFSQKGGGIFLAVGLHSQYLDKATGEIRETFTLLTDDPYPFFFEHGHDRSIFVIPTAKNEDWLFAKMKPLERFNFLRSNRISLDWDIALERPMKKGWEKRAPTIAEVDAMRVWGV